MNARKQIQSFLGADDDSVTALTDPGSTEHPTERVIAGIEKLVCLLYKPKTSITKVKDDVKTRTIVVQALLKHGVRIEPKNLHRRILTDPARVKSKC